MHKGGKADYDHRSHALRALMSEPAFLPRANDVKDLTERNWLPNFLAPGVLLLLISSAQVMVLIALLAGSPSMKGFWLRVGPASLLAQWITLCVACGLALSTPWLAKFRPFSAGLLALLLVAIISFACVLLSGTAQNLLAPNALIAPALDPYFALRITLIATLVAAALMRYAYVQHQWALEVQANARVKIAALTARIRPHFLFNSMNTLASLIAIDPERAEQVVEDLSELFRAALRAGEAPVPLAQELALAQQYLRIEQLRLGSRLQLDVDLAQAPAKLPVPSLLLQPLVENAVYHGIQPLEHGGLIRIQAIVKANVLTLSIANPVSEALTNPGNGMALENIRARLRLAFGARAHLITERAGAEFIATLVLPVS